MPYTITGRCYACERVFTEDADTVATVPVDPRTGLPPDVGGTPPERAVVRLICAGCMAEVKALKEQGHGLA
jgi:hypothetical protein